MYFLYFDGSIFLDNGVGFAFVGGEVSAHVQGSGLILWSSVSPLDYIAEIRCELGLGLSTCITDITFT